MIRSKWLALFLLLAPWPMHAQKVTKFQGITAVQDPRPDIDADPNGSIGTKQYLEYVNLGLQAYDKVTLAPLWSAPVALGSLWANNSNTPDCAGDGIHGDGMALFDRLASRWVVGGHTSPPSGNTNYFYCIAVSNTDDLSSSSLQWYAYEFSLNPILGSDEKGKPYFPDWPKLATWADAYYVSFDMLDTSYNYAISGVAFCAMDRTNILNNATANTMQCFKDGPSRPYLKHSPVPADVEGTTAPPSGRDEFFLSIQNPPRDGKTLTTDSLNLWNFHVDWTNPADSTFATSSVTVPAYIPGCYTTKAPSNAACIQQPAIKSGNQHYVLYSGADRLMPRLAYRNFGTYESFLISHTIQPGKVAHSQSAVGWYELRGNGSNTPSLFQSGSYNPNTSLYRFMPSIAQDSAGNVAMGYSVSSKTVNPGIRAIGWKLGSKKTKIELNIQNGGGSQENNTYWGTYTSMTVDPVDECTFWYVNEYQPSNETGKSINWYTTIANFQVTGCEAAKSKNPAIAAAGSNGPSK